MKISKEIIDELKNEAMGFYRNEEYDEFEKVESMANCLSNYNQLVKFQGTIAEALKTHRLKLCVDMGRLGEEKREEECQRVFRELAEVNDAIGAVNMMRED